MFSGMLHLALTNKEIVAKKNQKSSKSQGHVGVYLAKNTQVKYKIYVI